MNHSAWNRRFVISILAAVNFVLAGYLALCQWGVFATVWDPVFGSKQSAQVINSTFSVAFRRTFLIPDAALGSIAYLTEAVLSLIGSRERWREQPWLVVLFGANSLAVALVGVALVVLQAAVIEAWCLLCMATAALSVTMFILAFPEVRASLRFLKHAHVARSRASGGKKAVS